MKILRPFTVVGVYEDNGEAFVDWYMAGTAVEAARAATKENDSPMLSVLSVFHGHIIDVLCKQPSTNEETDSVGS